MDRTENARRHVATFRFYGELSDFLPAGPISRERRYRFDGKPSVKDAIEAQGVPHTEVELILASDAPVGFDHHLRDGERVAVYPPFRNLDLPPIAILRRPRPDPARFAIDVNLGKLARWLRLLGFDSEYRNDFEDRELVELAVAKNRILLTRDRRLLRHRELEHAYWVRSDRPESQIVEVLRRYRIADQCRPLRRCTSCNGELRPVSKESVLDRLEPLTRVYYNEFLLCEHCDRIYWRGSHHKRLLEKIKRTLGA